MIAFVALANIDDSPVDSTIVNRMIRAAGIRGGDRRACWMDGPIALAQCAPAGDLLASAVQPHANEEGTVRLVLDGRFDNGDDLLDAVGSAGRPLRGCSHAELLLRAYERWGDDCAARLVGDFAYAIWDGRRRALICARDILGTRPLYIHAGAKLVAVASEIVPLLRHPAVSRQPNEGFLAECLNGRARHPGDTVWRDIERLEPAHVLIVERGRRSVRRYWQPDPRIEIRHRSDDEYAEHLAALVTTATAARARHSGRVAMMLSGGIDSSSIVGALHELRLVDADRPLPTYSLAAPDAAWDEAAYLDAVAAMWPIDARRLPPFEPPSGYFIDQAKTFADLPPYPNGVMANGLFAEVAKSDTRVLLTGLWGDEALGTTFLHYADLIRGFEWRRLWSEFRANPDRADAFRPTSLFRSTVWPLVPRAVREPIKAALGRDGVAPWIRRDFARTVDLPSRERPQPSPVPFKTMAKRDAWASATDGVSIHATEAESRATSAFGLDTRHPFGDRRLLEFGYAIPDDQRWRAPYTKYVLRRAARRWAPALVRERLRHEGATSVVVRAVEAQVDAGLWQNAVTAQRGWVDLSALRATYEDMMSKYRAGDESYDRVALRLWFACGVEILARHVLEERDD